MPNGKTAELSYEETVQREDVIKTRFDVEVVWEHQISEMLKLDKQMKAFFDNEIVTVIPPRKLVVPVLPIRIGKMLQFPLCRSCALYYQDRSTLDADYNCTHNDDERALHVTTTHVELNLSLDHGYRVTKLDRVYTFPRWTGDLFKSYVRKFMKLKIEATGWPEHVKTDEDQAAFIRENSERYGITIDAANMVSNPAKRQIAKLCLNSLWGRFSLRNNLTRTEIVTDPAKFCRFVYDDTLKIDQVDMVADNVLYLTYRSKRDFTVENDTSNIFVSLWTTSMARAYLHKLMHAVVTTPGCQLLYTDTDSLIIVHPKGRIPVPMGDYLGDLNDEYKAKGRIVSFYCGGAKQYCLKYIKPDGTFGYDIKLRGITLNHGAAQTIHYDSFKKQVLGYQFVEPLSVKTTRFELSRAGKVHTLNSSKKYNATNQKMIIDPTDFKCCPIGYVRN
ncbi:hypothetical protein AAVH_06102 [Aphelenchoides avenae]|nr:hypothetical protein AAVH_06102 [Aphelenchus avenae]